MDEGVRAGGTQRGVGQWVSLVEELIRAVEIFLLPLRALCTEPRLALMSLCSIRRCSDQRVGASTLCQP